MAHRNFVKQRNSSYRINKIICENSHFGYPDLTPPFGCRIPVSKDIHIFYYMRKWDHDALVLFNGVLEDQTCSLNVLFKVSKERLA